MIQASGVRFGVEPAENPPRLKRMLLPLVGGDLDRHSLAVAATLARAAHMEVLLLAAESAASGESLRPQRIRLNARPSHLTIHAVSRGLARIEANLRGRGVRVRSYFTREMGDGPTVLRRVAAQEHVSMLVLAAGQHAALSFPEAARATHTAAIPTLLVSAAAANPLTHDALRRTSVLVPIYGNHATAECLLWAEALAQCCDGTIVLLRLGRSGGAIVHPCPLLPGEASESHHGWAAGGSSDGHICWPTSSVSVRVQSATDFGAALTRLRLNSPVIVVLPVTPARLEGAIMEGAISLQVLRALEASGVLTLIVPNEATPPHARDNEAIECIPASDPASDKESCHDATTHA
ncbi:MAG: hypothetical protein ACHQ4H_05175 [Ktedonobacterales bacterium]